MGYLALNLVFDDLRMRRVAGEVLDFNTASADFFRRLGFTPGDRIRRAVRRDGQDVDLLRFSMDGDDWRSREKARVLNLLQGNGTG